MAWISDNQSDQSVFRSVLAELLQRDLDFIGHGISSRSPFSVHHYALLEVVGTSLSWTAYDLSGNQIDTFALGTPNPAIRLLPYEREPGKTGFAPRPRRSSE